MMVQDKIQLHVGKKDVNTIYKRMKVKSLHYYKLNPRISSILIDYQGKLDDDIIHSLMDQKQPEVVRALLQRIKKDGRVNEPLIIYKNKVLEGNTRLWVVRELLNKSKSSSERDKWSYVPCRIVEEELDQEEINHILFDVHIKRKKNWSPFEFACYLVGMREEANMDYAKIQKQSGFGIEKIKVYIAVYKEMKKNKGHPNDWNRYYEAYKDKEVRELHESKKYDVMSTIKKKIKQGKMGIAQDSRKIKKIITSERATKLFFEKDEDINRAYDVALNENPEEGDPFLKKFKDMAEDISQIKFDKLEEFKKDNSKKELVKKLMSTLDNLWVKIK